MEKLWSYNKFKFINDNIIREYSEFNQYQMGIDVNNPLGPGYGFAIDPSLSIYGTDQDSPYVDYYARTGGSIARLSAISKAALNDTEQNIRQSLSDNFMEDVDDYRNFKILRIFVNNSLHLDIFISFDFKEDNYFGVFKNFNWYSEPKLDTELYTDQRYSYMDKEYKLKLSSYIKNILDKWFIPEKGLYKNLKDRCKVKGEMGNIVKLKKNSIVDVKGVDMEKDGTPYIIMKFKDNKYYLKGNDYFFFNYWFESVKK